MVKAKKVIDLTGTSKKTPASKIKKAHKKATRKSPRELKGKERYNIAVFGQVSQNLRFENFVRMCGNGPDKGYDLGVQGGVYSGKVIAFCWWTKKMSESSACVGQKV